MDSTVKALMAQLPHKTRPETEPDHAEIGDPFKTTTAPSIIFPHQQHVFRQLVITAKAFARENWFSLPILPRWHVLLVAPTGTGKSHLVRAFAAQMGWSIFTVWSARWIIAGARGRETWGDIAQWLATQNGKCIIFLEEADKISGNDTWSRHLRTEIFQLLERDLPREIPIDDSESEHSKHALWAKAKKTLMCDTLIIAAGAFQPVWDHRPKSLGFGGDSPSKNIPSQQELKTVLHPEFVNRFGQILVLPALGKQDYAEMARRTATALPAEIREKFIQIAEKNLAAAIENGHGARFVEECITAALLEDVEKTGQKSAVSRRRSINSLNE